MYAFELKSKLYFGVDSRINFLKTLSDSKKIRCGVVLDEGVAGQEAIQKFLQQELKEHGLEIACVRTAKVGSEPDYKYLDELASSFEGDLDLLFGIGGGSCMDLAKGVALLLKNPGKGIDYRGMDKVKNPGIPLVLIPTTAGTGSEVTATAAFIDREEKIKLGINGKHVAPQYSILDPMFTMGCPRWVTISSGMDALVHSVESFTANTASPLSRDWAMMAFRRLFNNLYKVLDTPEDEHVRMEMMLGAYQAGGALWNAAGGGPASAISYPIGVLHGVPHGLAGGLLLPYVIQFNEKAGFKGYRELFSSIERESLFGDPQNLSQAMAGLYKKIAAPKNFSSWDLEKKSIPELVRQTTLTRAANLLHNPVEFGEADVQHILENIVGGLPCQDMN